MLTKIGRLVPDVTPDQLHSEQNWHSMSSDWMSATNQLQAPSLASPLLQHGVWNLRVQSNFVPKTPLASDVRAGCRNRIPGRGDIAEMLLKPRTKSLSVRLPLPDSIPSGKRVMSQAEFRAISTTMTAPQPAGELPRSKRRKIQLAY
jgi:hypothetical protein